MGKIENFMTNTKTNIITIVPHIIISLRVVMCALALIKFDRRSRFI